MAQIINLQQYKEKLLSPDYLEYCIAEHYAAAIINNDLSGMNSDDLAYLNKFYSNMQAGLFGHFDGFGENDSLGFCIDDVSGLKANCHKVRFIIRKD